VVKDTADLEHGQAPDSVLARPLVVRESDGSLMTGLAPHQPVGTINLEDADR